VGWVTKTTLYEYSSKALPDCASIINHFIIHVKGTMAQSTQTKGYEQEYVTCWDICYKSWLID